jgi:hypothetical protein
VRPLEQILVDLKFPVESKKGCASRLSPFSLPCVLRQLGGSLQDPPGGDVGQASTNAASKNSAHADDEELFPQRRGVHDGSRYPLRERYR